jgi:predicted nuclease of predicted toxin-antitoxin system
VKFVVDAQLPPALARLVREAGCDAFAVREIGLREASDAAELKIADWVKNALLTNPGSLKNGCETLLFACRSPIAAYRAGEV